MRLRVCQDSAVRGDYNNAVYLDYSHREIIRAVRRYYEQRKAESEGSPLEIVFRYGVGSDTLFCVRVLERGVRR